MTCGERMATDWLAGSPVCRSCKMRADGRRAALIERNQQPTACLHCGKLSAKGRRHGRCHACYAYSSRTGRPRPLDRIENGRVVNRTEPQPCVECGRVYKPLRRGLCHACNERKRRSLARARLTQ